MELIFILAEIFIEVFPIYLFEVMEVERAFGIVTFVDDKVFPVFFGDERMPTVGAAQLHGREAALGGGESGRTDLTGELAFGAVILVKEEFRGITAGAAAVVRDIAFGAAADGADLFTIAFFIVRDKLFVRPVLAEVGDQREIIDLELPVFRGMGVIKSPLLERDVSADEIQ